MKLLGVEWVNMELGFAYGDDPYIPRYEYDWNAHKWREWFISKRKLGEVCQVRRPQYGGERDCDLLTHEMKAPIHDRDGNHLYIYENGEKVELMDGVVGYVEIN